jgi:hypothetical protein
VPAFFRLRPFCPFSAAVPASWEKRWDKKIEDKKIADRQGYLVLVRLSVSAADASRQPLYMGEPAGLKSFEFHSLEFRICL